MSENANNLTETRSWSSGFVQAFIQFTQSSDKTISSAVNF